MKYITPRVQEILVLAALVAGIVATLWGLFHLYWSSPNQFANDSIFRNTVFLFIGFLIIEASTIRLKINRFTSGAFAAFIIALLTGATWPLFVSAWFAFASYVLGLAALTVLKIEKEKISSISAFLVGAVIYGTTVGVCAHFPINYTGLYGIALAIPVIFGWRSIYHVTRDIGKFKVQPSEYRWFDLIIALVALYHFIVALMPEVGHDALAMHLFVPGHLAQRHEWGFDVSIYVWAVMPMLADWIFSIGYMLAGETAARMINVGFIFVLSWLIRELVLWAGGNATGARWAVLLFLTTPLTFTESSSLFIESVWASLIIAGSLSIFKCLQFPCKEQNAHLVAAGILLGGALATKAITYIMLSVLMILLVIRYRVWLKWSLIQAITLGLVLFFTIGTIPYVTAWILTENPVFPFFNHIFQSPYWPAVNFEAPAIFNKGITWDVLYQATFQTDKFLESKPGATGFQWLMLFVPAFLVLVFSEYRRGIALFIVAGLSIALVFHFTAYLRYVFPSFVWVAAGIGVALSDHKLVSISVGKALIITGWAVIVLNLVFFKSGTYYGGLSPQPLVSLSGRETYLNSRRPTRNAVELVNKLNFGRTPVAIFSAPKTAGLNADALYTNWYNFQFKNLVDKSKTPEAIANILLEKGVDYVILNDTWGSVAKRTIIENTTNELAKFGVVSVRKIKDKYRYQSEMLKNPNFSSYEGWSLSADTNTHYAGSITVSKSTPATQVVSVDAGRRYLYSATALCANKPSQGRLQVNWRDTNSKFMKSDIRVFECEQFDHTYSMAVVAPNGASSAVIYATGHTTLPVIFTEISFKR